MNSRLVRGRLAERRLDRAVVFSGETTVGEALATAEGRWVVVSQVGAGPVAAVRASALRIVPPDRRLAEVAPQFAPTVVAPASIEVRRLLTAPVMDHLEPDSAVVAVDRGTVVGVWAGPDLHGMLLPSVIRQDTDTELPGEVDIPMLHRTCRHAESAGVCTALVAFPERPASMPACPNPAGLAAHPFVW